MPTYEFECTKCQHVTEKICEIKQRRATTKCEKCGARAKFIMSVSTFTLVGSNWAKDGYGGGSTKKGKK